MISGGPKAAPWPLDPGLGYGGGDLLWRRFFGEFWKPPLAAI
jgi:hypothetical protein